MPATITNIAAEFNQFIPVIAAQHSRAINHMIDRFEEKNGVMICGGRYDAYSGASSIRPFMKFEHGRGSGKMRDVMVRDAERIETFSEQCATDEINSYVAKLSRKIGDLVNVELRNIRGANFTITGEWNGRRVTVDQQIVLKCSSKGKLFNQFPARIYVDGKFTTEKNFQNMVKGG